MLLIRSICTLAEPRGKVQMLLIRSICTLQDFVYRKINTSVVIYIYMYIYIYIFLYISRGNNPEISRQRNYPDARAATVQPKGYTSEFGAVVFVLSAKFWMSLFHRSHGKEWMMSSELRIGIYSVGGLCSAPPRKTVTSPIPSWSDPYWPIGFLGPIGHGTCVCNEWQYMDVLLS